MPIRNNPCHDVVSPAGQVVNPVESNVSYANTPNRAKYLSDIIHKIVSEERAPEPPETLEAPQVSTDAEKRLNVLLGALQSLYEEEHCWYLAGMSEGTGHILTELKAIIDSA